MADSTKTPVYEFSAPTRHPTPQCLISSELVSFASFQLVSLPFANDALRPFLSAEAIEFHYGKHHARNVNHLNRLCREREIEAQPLARLLQRWLSDDDSRGFHLAAETWNHEVLWRSLSPNPTEPSPALGCLISEHFGGLDKLRQAVVDAAASVLASGWLWLTYANETLAIETTRDANNPAARGIPCLLGLDLWEHAYYIDYRYDRERYVEAWWNHINWHHAAAVLADTTTD